jgi:hypothetical protein
VPLTAAVERADEDTVTVFALIVTPARSALEIVSSERPPNDVVPSTKGVTMVDDTPDTLVSELAYVK